MVQIKTDEQFPHLEHAPIVEAVMDIRARASVELEEDSIRHSLSAELSGYAFLDSHRQFQFGSLIRDGKPESEPVVDLGWKGMRFRSRDETQIVQVNKDGLVFSRLAPYQNWEEFSGEGLRLWNLFKTRAKPADIHRIGLRFINRIPLPVSEEDWGKYLNAPLAPLPTSDLPCVGFMHHDILAVPGHPYAVNVVRTIQPPDAGGRVGVILDIDVFTRDEMSLEENRLAQYLGEMRWLKNKVFFGSITEETKELCK